MSKDTLDILPSSIYPYPVSIHSIRILHYIVRCTHAFEEPSNPEIMVVVSETNSKDDECCFILRLGQVD